MFWRRKYPRLSEKFQMTYQRIDAERFNDNPIRNFALNISGGGICFETTELLPTNTMVALSLQGHDLLKPLLALAKVVWCKQKGAIYTVGAEFWWVGWRDPATQNAIADYVTSQIPEAVSS